MTRDRRPTWIPVVWFASLALGLVSAGVSLAEDKVDDKKPAAPTEKINFADHIQPIMREHCVSCHSQDDAANDLALDSYSRILSGGASGSVLEPGDADSSRLYRVVAHLENPKMPPEQDKISDAELTLLRKWIELGALETAGSKPRTKPKPAVDLNTVTSGSGRPEGQPAMPQGLSRDPVVYTERAAAATALATSPWAPLLAIGGQKQILLYNSDSRELVGVLPFPEGVPHVLKFSRSGAILLAGGGRHGKQGKVVLYDVKSGKRIIEIGDELDTVLAADINNTHTLVALGGPRRIVRVYSVADGELKYELKKHTDWIYALEFSPDGVLLASGDRSGGLSVWEANDGLEYQTMTEHRDGVTDVSWRADSNVLASVSQDGTLKLWEMDAGKLLKSVSAHSGGALSVCFTHDGQIVTGGRDNRVKTWKPDGSALRTFDAMTGYAMEVTFTHDGKQVVAGDLYGEYRVWDAESGALVGNLLANPPTLAVATEQASAEAKAAAEVAAKAQAEVTAAEKILQKHSAAAAELAKSAADSKRASAALEGELAALKKSIAAKSEALKKANQELAQAQKIAAQAQADAAAASDADKEESAQALAAAKKSLTQAKAARDKLAAELAADEKSSTAKAAQLKDAQASATKLAEQAATETKHKDTAAKLVEAKKAAAKKASDEAAAAKAAADALQKELQRAESSTAQLDKE